MNAFFHLKTEKQQMKSVSTLALLSFPNQHWLCDQCTLPPSELVVNTEIRIGVSTEKL